MSNPLLRKRKVSELICELPDDEGNPVPYHVRELGGTELDALEEILGEMRRQSGKANGAQGLRALFVCFSACDPSGKRYFDEAKDLAALQDAPGHLLDPLFLAAARINHRFKAEAEQLAKN